MNKNLILDLSRIEEAKSFMKDKYYIILGYFMEDAALYVAEIEEAVETGNLKQLFSSAHSLYSSSKQMGAVYLSVIADHIEQASIKLLQGEGDLTEVIELLPDLKDALLKTLEAYKAG